MRTWRDRTSVRVRGGGGACMARAAARPAMDGRRRRWWRVRDACSVVLVRCGSGVVLGTWGGRHASDEELMGVVLKCRAGYWRLPSLCCTGGWFRWCGHARVIQVFGGGVCCLRGRQCRAWCACHLVLQRCCAVLDAGGQSALRLVCRS
jgi:hypothetical protein